MSATAPPDELQGAALARGYFGIDVPFMRHIGLTPVSLAPGLARNSFACKVSGISPISSRNSVPSLAA